MNNILTIAHLTFHEARRRKLVVVGLIFGTLLLALFTYAFYRIYTDIQNTPAGQRAGPLGFGTTPETRRMILNSFLEMLTLAGLYAVNFLVVMMAVLTPVDTLSGEINSGAIQSLVTKPARRSEIMLGKWLGYWLLNIAYLFLMTGGILLIVRIVGGLSFANAPKAFGLMALEASVLISLSIAGGSRLSTLANGVLGFGMFALSFIGGWIEQIGAMINNLTAQNIGVVASLIVPSDVLWRLAASQLQSPLLRDTVTTPFTSATTPSNTMIFWAIGYCVVVMLIGLRQFAKRDL
jgi:ABC-type transport system involved in multi-copper enzyme maturation permease subunit